MKARPEPGQRWRSVIIGEEDAVEIVRVTDVKVEYRVLRLGAVSRTTRLDVFTVLYKPGEKTHHRTKEGGS